MVLLEFQVDRTVLAEDKESNPGAAEAAALQETYFVMPVRLAIENVELLQMPMGEQQVWVGKPGEQGLARMQREALASKWLPLPLLNVSTVGVEKVREARQNRVSTYSLPASGWRLRFERSGENICIHSEVNGGSGCARYEEVLHAFEDFASKVRNVLRREIPELNDHPYWGKWLNEAESGSRANNRQ